MKNDSNLYTGILKFRNINFVFILNREELRLIMPQDKEHEVMKWIYDSFLGESIQMEVPYLIGNCNENGHTLIIFTRQGSVVESYNDVLFVETIAYIDCDNDCCAIGKISFSSPEINYIHPVNNAFEYSYNLQNGVFCINTFDGKSTTTEKQVFKVDDVDVMVSFSVLRKLSLNNEATPLHLSSSMEFEFAPTNNYEFLWRLWIVAKRLLKFLCYRENVQLSSAELATCNEEGKFKYFATMHVWETVIDESKILEKGGYIRQTYISEIQGKLLTDIAANKIYLRHFPETYRSGKSKNAASFVMITAAFEWEFHRLYPDGIKKSESTLKAEQSVSETIEKLISSSTGKLKDKYSFLKRLIKSYSLQSKIIQIGKDFDDIIGIFGKKLYEMNNKTLVYSDMGQRLSDQRNHFAHGDLDKEFIGISLLDLVFMEYVIYAMQLKYYGASNENIQKAINELFYHNLKI